MKENNVKTKSYEFAIRIVNLFKWLSANEYGHVLSKQLLRCGTISSGCEELVRILSAITKTLREKNGSVRETSDFNPESLYSTPNS